MLGIILACVVLAYALGRRHDFATSYRHAANFLVGWYAATTILLFLAWKFAIGLGAIVAYWAFGPIAALFAASLGATVAIFTVGMQMVGLIAGALCMRLAVRTQTTTADDKHPQGVKKNVIKPTLLVIGILLFILILRFGY